MKGFFQTVDVTDKSPASLIPKCGKCGLFKKCKSPKMPPSGKGRKRILIVGEAPGKTEDQQGIQFIGESGQLLQEVLTNVGIDFRRDCWVTNAVICRPSNNLLPPKAPEHCQATLINTIKELNPEVIIPLGAVPIKSLLNWLWKEDFRGVGQWAGWQIPVRRINAWVCPNWHPAHLLREGKGFSKESQVRMRLFERYIRSACELGSRPWKKVTDNSTKVQCLFDDNQANKLIRTFIKNNKPVAFDYETDRLKPDHSDATIISCSISDGETTIAYPWFGKFVTATQELLRSEVKKIGSNIKFEERWTRRILKHGVRGWLWDTMLAAHTLDSRPNITSIKFQAFIHLGVDSWDEHIKPYLKAKDSNSPNRIREIPLEKLLIYNGLDSLYEWKVAQIQMELMRDHGK